MGLHPHPVTVVTHTALGESYTQYLFTAYNGVITVIMVERVLCIVQLMELVYVRTCQTQSEAPYGTQTHGIYALVKLNMYAYSQALKHVIMHTACIFLQRQEFTSQEMKHTCTSSLLTSVCSRLTRVPLNADYPTILQRGKHEMKILTANDRVIYTLPGSSRRGTTVNWGQMTWQFEVSVWTGGS